MLVRVAASSARAASQPEAQELRGGTRTGHAGSWRADPGRSDVVRRGTWSA